MSVAVVPEPVLRLRALPGVFHPRSDAQLVADLVAERGLARERDVLDVFTGSGVLALSAARCGARSVTAVDVSRRAAATVWFNARRNGVAVRVRRGDIFTPLVGERFDLILANPPYLPGPAALPRHGAARAWEGGEDGRRLLDRLCAEARDHLRPGGRLLLVHSSLIGEQATLTRLAEAGLEPSVMVRKPGRLGPLLRARVALLRERGLLGAEETEDLLVICGLAA